MDSLDPLDVERGDQLVVEDTTSAYDGTKGRALQIYDDSIELELNVWMGCGKLTRRFTLEQLRRPE